MRDRLSLNSIRVQYMGLIYMQTQTLFWRVESGSSLHMEGQTRLFCWSRGVTDSITFKIVSTWYWIELNDRLTREKDAVHPYVRTSVTMKRDTSAGRWLHVIREQKRKRNKRKHREEQTKLTKIYFEPTLYWILDIN